MTPKKIFITGGAGYVGSVLTPTLLNKGYHVTVFDLFIYGRETLRDVADHPNLTIVEGDLRNLSQVSEAIRDHDTVIHLACISNDPSFELDEALGKSINYDCFPGLVQIAKDAGVSRFIYASSSSVYGIKESPNVTEDMKLEPLTSYSKYKALCEDILLEAREPGFTVFIVRPATVCGYSPRLRLDLTVNILTNHAYHNRKIKVFGGKQLRPNIHIKDMVEFYCKSLLWSDEQIDGKIYNVGYENHSVGDIANMVKEVAGSDIGITVEPTDDNRSYHISSAKIKEELGFTPSHTIKDAVQDLIEAFDAKKVTDSMENPYYFNIKRMNEINLS